MEKADIKKKIHLALVALIFYIQKGTAFSTSPSALTRCAYSTADISFNFSIDGGETIAGNRIWFFGAAKIAESDGTTLTPVPSYSSRLTAYGTSGISLSNITVADAGTYTYVIVLSPTFDPFTAITALSVQVAPLAPPSGCQVSATQSGNIPTCTVNTNSGKCGTPSLIAFLVNSTFTCKVGETYQCCATSAALTCYSGSSNEFCKLFTCTDVTTTTTTSSNSSTTTLFADSSTSSITTMTSAKAGSQTGAIVGGTLGGLAGIGILVGVIYCIHDQVKKKQTENKDKKTEEVQSELTVKKGKTENSGSSAVSRQQVQVQMDTKGVKSDDEERSTAVHTRTPNESNTNSKQTSHRQQPVPPANTGCENTPTFRRRPQPPQNGEIKDQSLRGISATIDDKPDLASETPRPNRLRPLTPKQATVEKEDASEEPRKKRKKKKKKDQNVEENGETDLRVN